MRLLITELTWKAKQLDASIAASFDGYPQFTLLVFLISVVMTDILQALQDLHLKSIKKGAKTISSFYFNMQKRQVMVQLSVLH